MEPSSSSGNGSVAIERRRLAALLCVLSSETFEGSDECRQVFLEMTLTHIDNYWPELGKIAHVLVKASRGRDFSADVVYPSHLEEYSGQFFDSI